MNAAAAFLATALVVAVVGSYVIARVSAAVNAQRRTEAEWWAVVFTPNRHGDLTPHTHPDQTTERPLLATDYLGDST